MRNVEVSYFDLVVRTRNALEANKVKSKRFSRCVTFQVTNGCNLNCSYCYQICKGSAQMTKETGIKLVDYLYELYDKDEPDGFINKETENLQIDFIGGEPFLNVATMEAICDHFFEVGLKKRHIWIENLRISISTNGTLYFNEDVQRFLKKYHNFISLSVTIDGPKELHDVCRKDYSGNGSFDTAMAAVEHYRKNYGRVDSTKITISPENLPYINHIVNFARNNGFTNIASNTVAEADWTIDHAREYYNQLKELANDLLQNNETDVAITLFNSNDFKPLPTTHQDNWCGGTGEMLAFDSNGVMYPCIRYMESSLGSDQPPLIIGNLETGLYGTPETRKIRDEFYSITRRSQSTDECFHCSIASGCAWCSAWNYQKTGSSNKRATTICIMHQARSLANVYFWNSYYALNKREKRMPLYLDQKKAIEIIGEEEYNMLLETTGVENNANI